MIELVVCRVSEQCSFVDSFGENHSFLPDQSGSMLMKGNKIAD